MQTKIVKFAWAGAVFVSLFLASAVTAQDKNGSEPHRPLITPYAHRKVVPGIGRPALDPNAPAKICFWRDVSGGTAFGKSGYCPYPSSNVVGSPCSCTSPHLSGRPSAVTGVVMLAPVGDGSTPVVR